MANDKATSPGKTAPRGALRTLAKAHVCLHGLSGGYRSAVLLVASQTGRPTNPIWYKNLVKHPESLEFVFEATTYSGVVITLAS